MTLCLCLERKEASGSEFSVFCILHTLACTTKLVACRAVPDSFENLGSLWEDIDRGAQSLKRRVSAS